MCAGWEWDVVWFGWAFLPTICLGLRVFLRKHVLLSGKVINGVERSVAVQRLGVKRSDQNQLQVPSLGAHPGVWACGLWFWSEQQHVWALGHFRKWGGVQVPRRDRRNTSSARAQHVIWGPLGQPTYMDPCLFSRSVESQAPAGLTWETELPST